MKLALTRKYIEEIKAENCDPSKNYVEGYGINRIFFNFWGPKPRMMFVNEEELIIVYLSSMLSVKNTEKITFTPNTKIELNGGVMVNKLKVTENGQVIFKSLINKKLVGFGDMQKNFNNFLRNLANK